MVNIRRHQTNEPLRLTYYGFLLVILIFFFVLVYVAADVLTCFIRYNIFINFSAIPFLLGGVTLVSAILSLVVTTVGFAGIRKLKSQLIYVFVIFLSISIVFNAVVSIAAFSTQKTLRPVLNQFMPSTVVLYDDFYLIDYRKSWDYIQSHYDCCGAHNYTDWKRIFPRYKLPQSCCYELTDCNVNSMYLRENGCLDPLLAVIEQKVFAIACATATFVVVQIFGAIVAALALRYSRTNTL